VLVLALLLKPLPLLMPQLFLLLPRLLTVPLPKPLL
jgi:hypothetical protein